jgi:hypothetical protein
MDLLLNAYEQLGETIPQLLQYDRILAEDAHIERVLGLVYRTFLSFIAALWLFSNVDIRSNYVISTCLSLASPKAWKQVFRSTWKDFNTHFRRLLENFHRHKSDIESQASLVEIGHNQASREIQERKFLDAEMLDRRKQAIAVIEKISPASFDPDQEIMVKNWIKELDFGGWLFSHEKNERLDRLKKVRCRDCLAEEYPGCW